jgi:hypothetical protein
MIPDIYKESRDSNPFNYLKFFFVFLGGIIHSVVIYFIPMFITAYGIVDNSGRVKYILIIIFRLLVCGMFHLYLMFQL